MRQTKNRLPSFSEEDMRSFEPEMKIGLLATVNDRGLPHLTLISTLKACSPTGVIWGQFTEGLCKDYVRANPKTGFLIMTLDRNLWRGKATWTHSENSGIEFEAYNNTPMFRYNAYFGIHTVHYMDLVEQTGKEPLPMNAVVASAILTRAAGALFPRGRGPQALNAWTQRLFNGLSNLKFLAFVGEDGYPAIVPVIQTQAAGNRHILFAASPYGCDLEAIPARANVAVFGMTFGMEDVLVRGSFRGLFRAAGIRCGAVEVDWVYNPMQPKPQQIYPEVDLVPVTEFETALPA